MKEIKIKIIMEIKNIQHHHIKIIIIMNMKIQMMKKVMKKVMMKMKKKLKKKKKRKMRRINQMK